jgi:hypothetical protein
MWQFPATSPHHTLKKAKLSWEIQESKEHDNWHADAHEHSESYERYAFEISELEKDLAVDPSDHRLLYYLGFDHLAAWEAGSREGVAPEVLAEHIEKSFRYLEQRAQPRYTAVTKAVAMAGEALRSEYGNMPSPEMTISTLQYLGIMSYKFRSDSPTAHVYYDLCVAYENDDYRCHLEKSRLLADEQKWGDAWLTAKAALASAIGGAETAKAVNRDAGTTCDAPVHVLHLTKHVGGAVEAAEIHQGVQRALGAFSQLDRCSDEVRKTVAEFEQRQPPPVADWDAVLSEASARRMRSLPRSAQSSIYEALGLAPISVGPELVKKLGFHDTFRIGASSALCDRLPWGSAACGALTTAVEEGQDLISIYASVAPFSPSGAISFDEFTSTLHHLTTTQALVLQ